MILGMPFILKKRYILTLYSAYLNRRLPTPSAPMDSYSNENVRGRRRQTNVRTDFFPPVVIGDGPFISFLENIRHKNLFEKKEKLILTWSHYFGLGSTMSKKLDLHGSWSSIRSMLYIRHTVTVENPDIFSDGYFAGKLARNDDWTLDWYAIFIHPADAPTNIQQLFLYILPDVDDDMKLTEMPAVQQPQMADETRVEPAAGIGHRRYYGADRGRYTATAKKRTMMRCGTCCVVLFT